MRISSNTIYDTGVANLQQQSARLMQIQEQIGASRRILTPSDDPSGAARVLEISQSQGISQQFDANIGAASDSLALEESVLASISDVLQSAKDATNAAGNGGYNQSDRLTLASALRGQYQELLGLANSTDTSGQYMFAGYRSATSPFSQTSPGVVAYNGDQGQRLLQVGPTRQIEVSDSGGGLFVNVPDGNGSFVTKAGTNTGTGLIDNGNVLDVTKWDSLVNKNFSIKFAGTATVAAATTNTVGGASGKAGIVNQTQWNAGSKNYSIKFTATPPAATYDIIDNATGNALVTGAAYTSGATINFKGMDVVITDGAVALNVGDRFTINPGAASSLTYDIQDSTGKSLLDGRTGGSPPYVRSYSPGTSISLKSEGAEPAFDYGVETKISGAPAAGDTFSIAPSTTKDVFKTLSDLAALLESGSGATARTNELSRMQLDLTNALNNIIAARSSVGTRMKELDGLKNGNDSLALQYSQSLSRLQDLDYAKAASDFTQQQVTLQAAQQTFVKVAGLSLFNYL